MKTEAMEIYAPVFAIAWVVFGIGLWVWLSTRPTAEEKRWWHLLFCIVAGIIFGVFVSYFVVVSQMFIALPLIWLFIGVIIYLNIRLTFFCASCGKMSVTQTWLSKAYFCPRCGHELK